MEHVRSFSGFPGLDKIRGYLSNDQDHPAFEKSELYSSKVDAKIVNEDLRRSQFRIFEDSVLFQHVESVVSWLNDSDSTFVYQLRRDNITETRYEAGGHFLKHKDFLSVTSNLVEEFTLILCVTHEGLGASGGETLIYPYASEKGTAYDTTTPGNGLLFRKDLEHAGGVLKSGHKHILTANIIATRKQCSDQVLFVTFPSKPAVEGEEKEDNTKKEISQSPGDILQRVADQGSSYVLPVDSLKGSMLEAHVRFFNQQYDNEDEDLPKVITYQCIDFTYEEFGTVAKILLSSYIQEENITKHARCIDYFGPFTNEKLLVNLASIDRKEDEAEEAGDEDEVEAKKEGDSDNEAKHCKRFVQPSIVSNAESLFSAQKKAKSTSSSSANEDYGVIVCENESRTKAVYEMSRVLGFSSYIPFKMVFVRGVMLHGYYDRAESVPLTTAGLVVGDYNHVFALQNIGGQHGKIDACTVKDYHTVHNYFSQADPPGWDDKNGTLFTTTGNESFDEYESDEFDEYFLEVEEDQLYDFQQKPRGMGLKLALGDEDPGKKLSGYALGFLWSEYNDYHGATLHDLRPLSEFLGGKASAEDSGTMNLFHRDDSGRATFTAGEAAAASNYIASMNLDERVLAAVKQKRFELTQELEEKNDYYCNESTYSNLSLLYVTGLIRLDPSVEATSTAVTMPRKEFESESVWPNKGQRKAAREAAMKHFKQSRCEEFVPSNFYENSYFRCD